MKKFILSIFIIHTGMCFSQIRHGSSKSMVPVVEAKEAYKHVGELVEVRDTIYSGRVINDTTAVLEIGAKTSTSRLIMIYIQEFEWCYDHFRPKNYKKTSVI